jgi:hypothetical protein
MVENRLKRRVQELLAACEDVQQGAFLAEVHLKQEAAFEDVQQVALLVEVHLRWQVILLSADSPFQVAGLVGGDDLQVWWC